MFRQSVAPASDLHSSGVSGCTGRMSEVCGIDFRLCNQKELSQPGSNRLKSAPQSHPLLSCVSGPWGPRVATLPIAITPRERSACHRNYVRRATLPIRLRRALCEAPLERCEVGLAGSNACSASGACISTSLRDEHNMFRNG